MGLFFTRSNSSFDPLKNGDFYTFRELADTKQCCSLTIVSEKSFGIAVVALGAALGVGTSVAKRRSAGQRRETENRRPNRCIGCEQTSRLPKKDVFSEASFQFVELQVRHRTAQAARPPLADRAQTRVHESHQHVTERFRVAVASTRLPTPLHLLGVGLLLSTNGRCRDAPILPRAGPDSSRPQGRLASCVPDRRPTLNPGCMCRSCC